MSGVDADFAILEEAAMYTPGAWPAYERVKAQLDSLTECVDLNTYNAVRRAETAEAQVATLRRALSEIEDVAAKVAETVGL